MKPIVMLVLAGMAILAIFVPFIPPSSNTEIVKIYEQGTNVLLVGKSGYLEFPLSSFELVSIYDSENPFDFFSNLVDPSQISRLEILPYGTDTICNVFISGQDKGLAGKSSFCISLSLRTGIPIFVSEDLLVLDASGIEGL